MRLKGWKMSEEQKQKIRATMIGRTYSEERRAAMRKPRKPLSEAHKQKISESMEKYLNSLTEDEFTERMMRTWTANLESNADYAPLDPKIMDKMNVFLGLK